MAVTASLKKMENDGEKKGIDEPRVKIIKKKALNKYIVVKSMFLTTIRI